MVCSHISFPFEQLAWVLVGPAPSYLESVNILQHHVSCLCVQQDWDQPAISRILGHLQQGHHLPTRGSLPKICFKCHGQKLNTVCLYMVRNLKLIDSKSCPVTKWSHLARLAYKSPIQAYHLLILTHHWDDGGGTLSFPSRTKKLCLLCEWFHKRSLGSWQRKSRLGPKSSALFLNNNSVSSTPTTPHFG